MPDEKETIWLALPHTLAKHRILSEYLAAWLPIMVRTFPRIQYIDGFAGPGIYTRGEPGSPIIALTIAIQHRQLQSPPPKHGIDFYFIEERTDRYHCLKSEIEKLLRTLTKPPWITERTTHGSFATEAMRIPSEAQGKLPRLLFADPFGYDLPMTTLAHLMDAKSSEVFMFFDYADLHRFIQDPSKSDAIDRLYLCQEWRQYLALPEAEQREALLALYRRQLRTNCHFNHVWRFELVNLQQQYYFLIYGTRSDEGLRRMKHAYWKVDPERGRYFVDPKHTDQVALFPAKSTVENLPGILLDRFKGQTIPIDDLAKFVLYETDFVDDMHLKKRTLLRMEQATPPQIRVIGRKGNIVGRYKSTVIQFL